MNINIKQRGDKITVSEESLYNGYPDETIRARKHLKIGEIYTIDSINVGNWATYIKLVEFPNVTFNSVSFIDKPKTEKNEDLAALEVLDYLDLPNSSPPKRKSKIVNINVRVEISYFESNETDEALDIKAGINTAIENVMFIESHSSTGRKVLPLNADLIKDKECEHCRHKLNYANAHWECRNEACLHNDLPF